MQTSSMLEVELESWEVDPVEEIRLRTWARKNYTPQTERDATLHPVILDEMMRIDSEE